MHQLAKLMKYIKLYNVFFLLLFFSCSEKIPVATEWIGLDTKQGVTIEKIFKTAGKGVGPVTWWAGGYTYEGGFFIIELVDVKKKETVHKKKYEFGDNQTGNDEKPRFFWWHSEEKGKIFLAANRVYKMILKTENLAEPGAGWGMWLYKIGEKSQNRENPKN